MKIDNNIIKYLVLFIGFLMIPLCRTYAQISGFDQFDFLIGDWAGTGEGFYDRQRIRLLWTQPSIKTEVKDPNLIYPCLHTKKLIPFCILPTVHF